MSFKDVKELRKLNKLDEAYEMALQDLQASPGDIWNKRSLSWVLYDFIKLAIDEGRQDRILDHLDRILELAMPPDEKMLYENLALQLARYAHSLCRDERIDNNKLEQLLDRLVQIPFPRPSRSFTALCKAFTRTADQWDKFTDFFEWWGIGNFLPEDYLSETNSKGDKFNAPAEYAIMAYARKLDRGRLVTDEQNIKTIFHDLPKIRDFLERLDPIILEHPELQYLPYFKARLLLRLGDKDNALKAFLPFARSKQGDYWVWELMAEAFPEDRQMQLACYCKAMICKTPPHLLRKVKLKLAKILVYKGMHNEARTEIESIVSLSREKEWHIPQEAERWMRSSWYAAASTLTRNEALYKKHAFQAEEVLIRDIAPVTAVVEFVNKDKKVAHFVVSKELSGSFKYNRFFNKLTVGDILELRLEQQDIQASDGIHKMNADAGFGEIDRDTQQHYQLVLFARTSQAEPGENILKKYDGRVTIRPGNDFGFAGDIFISPDIIKQQGLRDGDFIRGKAVITFNKKRQAWGWKAITVELVDL